MYEALKLGLRDYVEKIGFKRVVVALSGGIDSAVTACIAAEALELPVRGYGDHPPLPCLSAAVWRFGGEVGTCWAAGDRLAADARQRPQ